MNCCGRRWRVNVKDEIDAPGYLLFGITDVQQDHPERDDRSELLQPIPHQLPVILRIAVRTFLTFCESDHAMTTSSPDSVIRGTPLDVPETTIAGALDPSGLMMRARTSAPPGVRSTQLTKALPERRAMTSTRPIGLPSPTRICEPKVAPPSAESAA
jgi:hypothetical protein